MMRTMLALTILTVGLSISDAGHALLIWTPTSPKMNAQIVGSKLMVVDPGGKMTPAGDGAYQTDDGRTLSVKGGVITSQGAIAGPTGSKGTGGIMGPIDSKADGSSPGGAVGPMYNSPASPGVPGGGNAPTAPSPTSPPPVVTGGKLVHCPLKIARTEVVSKLPKGWWQTPYEGPLVGTRVEMIGGEKTLVCEYQAYTTRASVMTKVPASVNCVAVTEGFNCR